MKLSRRRFLHHGAMAGLGIAGAPLLGATLAQAQPEPDALTGNYRPVHDPCIIKQGDTYYLYCTGRDHSDSQFTRFGRLGAAGRRLRGHTRMGESRHSPRQLDLGTGHFVFQQPLSSLLFGVQFRQQSLAHWAGDDAHARSK